jgi:hypothetical protein
LEQEKLNIKTSWIYFALTFIFGVLLVWVEIASTSLTLNFFRGLGGEGIVKNGVTGFAVANDIIKVIGITLGIVAYRMKEKSHFVIFVIAGVVTLTISFFASQAYDLNMAAKLKNETVTKSGGYKRQEELYNTTKDSLEENQKQLKSMTTIEMYVNNNNEIKEIKKQIKELGSLTSYQKKNNSYYGSRTYKAKANNENAKLKNEYDNKIKNLTNKLIETEKRLRNEYIETKAETEKNIERYTEKLDNTNSGFSKITEGVELETSEGMEQFSKSYGWSIVTIATGKNVHLEFIGVVLAIMAAFCWRLHKKYKELELNGEYEGIDIKIPTKESIITTESQNTLEMKNTKSANNIRNKLIEGINRLTKTKKPKKVNLQKEVKIGFDLTKQKISDTEIKTAEKPNINNKSKIEQQQPKLKQQDTAKIKNSINFIKIDGVTPEQIKLYIKIGFEFSKNIDGNIIFPGYKKIADESNNKISLKIARAINIVFSEKGITEIIDTKMGKRTCIKFTKSELFGDE